jgi:hypothetical protein
MQNTNPNTNNIYRYKLSPNIQDLIKDFTRIHNLDDRQQFKENWEVFLNNNRTIIQNEEERLKKLSYKKDIKVMMYKSARYYYLPIINNTIQTNNTKRKEYISFSNDFNKFIQRIVTQHISDNIKPSEGFKNLLENNYEIINTEIKNYQEKHDVTIVDINTKIKKIYKNKYYVHKNNKKE